MDVVISVVLYATASTIIAQLVAIGFMWWLGLPPKKLAHEIEDVQNAAVGASFFIIALITSLWFAVLTADPAPAETDAGTYLWIFGGVVLAFVYTMASFWIAHHALDRIEGENVYSYIRRELIDEQNTALAFFLGGLMTAPFIAVLGQII